MSKFTNITVFFGDDTIPLIKEPFPIEAKLMTGYYRYIINTKTPHYIYFRGRNGHHYIIYGSIDAEEMDGIFNIARVENEDLTLNNFHEISCKTSSFNSGVKQLEITRTNSYNRCYDGEYSIRIHVYASPTSSHELLIEI